VTPAASFTARQQGVSGAAAVHYMRGWWWAKLLCGPVLPRAGGTVQGTDAETKALRTLPVLVSAWPQPGKHPAHGQRCCSCWPHKQGIPEIAAAADANPVFVLDRRSSTCS
jgi:hypothetical protein